MTIAEMVAIVTLVTNGTFLLLNYKVSKENLKINKKKEARETHKEGDALPPRSQRHR